MTRADFFQCVVQGVINGALGFQGFAICFAERLDPFRVRGQPPAHRRLKVRALSLQALEPLLIEPTLALAQGNDFVHGQIGVKRQNAFSNDLVQHVPPTPG